MSDLSKSDIEDLINERLNNLEVKISIKHDKNNGQVTINVALKDSHNFICGYSRTISEDWDSFYIEGQRNKES